MSDPFFAYKQYALDVVGGNIPAGLYIRQACQRYLDWFNRDDIEFRPSAADKPVRWIERLRLYGGADAGKPFILTPVQRWMIYAIYGWYYRNTNQRVTTQAFILIGRKFGKSMMAAAIGLYELAATGTPDAQVVIAATSAKQAGELFEKSLYLSQSVDPKSKYLKRFRDSIKFPLLKSKLRVVCADADVLNGLNCSCYIVDELAFAPDDSVLNVLQSSTIQRENPLGIIITTAGFNLLSPAYNLRNIGIEILAGLKQNDSEFYAIFELDEGDDWRDEKVWPKTLPNIGVTVRPENIRAEVVKGQNNPSYRAEVEVKYFNRWMKTANTWIPVDVINRISRPVNLSDYRGMSAYVGVDLASVSDLTSVSWMVPTPEGKVVYKTFYYLPSMALNEGENQSAYRKWSRTNELRVCPGNVTDYDTIIEDILRIQQESGVYVSGIYLDKWNATQAQIEMQGRGLPVTQIPQGLFAFSTPTKELERLILSDRVIIDNNQITRWCFSNVILKSDHNDNVKPTKTKNANKIDGVISMIQCVAGRLQDPYGDTTIV